MEDQNLFQVIYEDNHLLIVNKESGLLVQSDDSEAIPLEDLAKNYLKKKYNKEGNVFCGVIHRLDRPVSGLVILAKSSKALERMNEQFRERTIQKTYWALTTERPPKDSDTLKHWLTKDKDSNTVKAFNKETKNAQEAILDYKILGKWSRYFLIEVKPITGRPHQIRVQLAKIGCPILGDLKYGHQEKGRNGRIYLHSRKVEFQHPVRKDFMRITARLPIDQIWQLFEDVPA
ncbi:MAG: RNA pseudouridine synthase [Flammeovirgaceae bacterium]